MDPNAPFDRQVQSDARSVITGAVQNPLGFFTLAVLIIEGILGALAYRAEGLDFTLLVCGMLGLFALLILAFAVLVHRNQNIFIPVGAPHVETEARTVSKDFVTGFFKKDFYDKMRDAATRVRKNAENLKIEKITVIHYIRNDFQIGFRAYEGLSPIRRDADGSLPLYVSTDWGGRAVTVDYFDWNDDASPPAIGSRTAVQPNGTPAVTVNAKAGPRHLSIFKYYDDLRRTDFFHVNAFSVGSDVPLNHYVVVRNDDLAKWNPNKFIFEVKPDGSIDFASAVYVTRPILKDAQENHARKILSKFVAIADLPKSDETEHFHKVREHINEIFHENSFRQDVTVFWLQRKANEINLFLVYVFPPPGSRDCLRDCLPNREA